jgi:thymidylate synthase (methanogen type)
MLIEEITISEAWEKSIIEMLKKFKKGKELVPTERGDMALEFENILLKIKKPLADDRISTRYPYQDFSRDYSLHLFDQGYHQQVYSRITETSYDKKNYINQIDEIVKKLKNEYFSRRGVVSLWNPFEDIHSDHPPCICLLQFYIRRETLCLTSTYRSNDAWLCAPADMVAITNMQINVAEKVEKPVGIYSHFAVSYHIYSSDLPMAMKIFNEQ